MHRRLLPSARAATAPLLLCAAVCLSACMFADFDEVEGGRHPDVVRGGTFDVHVAVSGVFVDEDKLTVRALGRRPEALVELHRLPDLFENGFTAQVRCDRAGALKLGVCEGDRVLASVEVRCAEADALRLRPYAPARSGVREEPIPPGAPLRLLAAAPELADTTDGAAFSVAALDEDGQELIGRLPLEATSVDGVFATSVFIDDELITHEDWSRVRVVPRAASGSAALTVNAGERAVTHTVQIVPIGQADRLEIASSVMEEVRDGEQAYAWLRAADAQGPLFHVRALWSGPVPDLIDASERQGDLLSFVRGGTLSDVTATVRDDLSATKRLPIRRVVSVSTTSQSASGCHAAPPSTAVLALLLLALLAAPHDARRRRTRV